MTSVDGTFRSCPHMKRPQARSLLDTSIRSKTYLGVGKAQMDTSRELMLVKNVKLLKQFIYII